MALEQEGYRWRSDDGAEAAATWLTSQDGNITRRRNLNTRIRITVVDGGTPGNNFSSDPNCKALWRFESGALTTDSKGTNTLTNVGVDEDTVNFMEGACAGKWVAANSDRMYITDANLDAGFPLKSGDTNKKISLFMRLKIASFAGDGFTQYIFARNDATTTTFQFLTYNDAGNGKLQLTIGFNGGASTETVRHATILSTGTKYYVTVSFSNDDYSYAIRIRDENGNVVGTDLTGTMTLDAGGIYVGSADLNIGGKYDLSHYYDGLIDEMVAFSDIITADEATNIAKGIYG